MTTKVFAGGHGAPSSFEYDPAQPRDAVGQWTTDDDGLVEWEVAINMSQAEWDKLSDAQRADLFAAVITAADSNEPKAAATLTKLKGWGSPGKHKGSGGGGGGHGGSDKGKKREKHKPVRTAADPENIRRSHKDGTVVAETNDGKARLRWDAKTKNYVAEKRDGDRWIETKRISIDEAYKAVKNAPKRWLKPRRQGKKAGSKKTLTAGAEPHTGAMIALVPSADRLAELAVDGGEDADQLHMTEVYLGTAADISDEDREYIIDTVADLARRQDPVTGDAFSVAMFNPPGSEQSDGVDRESCVVLGVSGADVAAFHEVLLEHLEDAEIDFPEQHEPRIPHVTLAYTDDADLSYFTDKTGPITFDTVRVAFAGEAYDIPLGEERGELTASAEDVNRDDVLAFDNNDVPVVPNVLIDLAAFAKERDVNGPGGPGHQLRNYWVKGEGAAKIRWKTPGDWTRCVRNLSKYVKDPKGLCSEYHHQATGMWPGDKRNPGMSGDIETSDDTMLYAVDGAESIIAATEDGIVTDHAHPAAWRGVLTVEGIESGDGRMFGTDALTWDQLPLPLRWQKESAHGGQNDVTVSVGNIEKIWREPSPDGRAGVNFIMGEGSIDLGNPDGAEVFRRMKRGYMRGNSVDVDSVKGADVELIFPESTSGPLATGEDDVQIFDMSRMQPELTKYNKGRIRATTLVEIPAFTEARLELVNNVTADTNTVVMNTEPDESSEPEENVNDVESPLVVDETMEAIIAATSTITIADAPPREWFSEPKDVTPTGALTITPEGRIYGYVAPLGVRHRSFADRDVLVPTRRVDYTRFMGGETIVADGGRVSTGAITMNCGHASVNANLTASQAAEHYDNTCSMVATVRVGENRNGVWMAGALLPDVTPDQLRRIMASRLSGDWRAHLDKPGWREFVAALLVPVPGFPMARTSPSVTATEGVLVASTVPVQLIADTKYADNEHDDKKSRILAARLAVLRARVRQVL